MPKRLVVATPRLQDGLRFDLHELFSKYPGLDREAEALTAALHAYWVRRCAPFNATQVNAQIEKLKKAASRFAAALSQLNCEMLAEVGVLDKAELASTQKLLASVRATTCGGRGNVVADPAGRLLVWELRTIYERITDNVVTRSFKKNRDSYEELGHHPFGRFVIAVERLIITTADALGQERRQFAIPNKLGTVKEVLKLRMRPLTVGDKRVRTPIV